MERRCNRCGCASFHYNHNRMRMECDQCGHPFSDPQQEQQLMQYDRTYAYAMDHLAAGNWEQTISLLKPLVQQYPTDKKLYLAILQAATHDFRDIVMANTSLKNAASEAWDKLIRLNCITGDMISYGRRRYELHMEELGRKRNTILGFIFAAAFCSMLAGILIILRHNFLAFVFIALTVIELYLLYQVKPVDTLRQLTAVVPDHRSNPFR